MPYTSHHGQILIALLKKVKELQPDGLEVAEIEVRDDWTINGEPIRGITIYPAGESQRDGTVGTQDVGYMCGIAFVKYREGDATLASDNLMRWRELIRRELQNSRLGVTIYDNSYPSEHTCIIADAGRNLSNNNKFPQYWINHLTIGVWIRELGT